ncbi:MAG: flagellar basal body P-ring formation protein FlgA [Balneolaceae bacterium]|nr:flagellar basal body P-ring formation protein FlgA [Balneolaceae bacterium]
MFLALLICINALLLVDPHTPVRPFNDTKEVIIEKARESVENHYSPEQYRFNISARWIPGSLLKSDPEHVKSVELKGVLKEYSTFEVIYRRENGKVHDVEIQLLIEAQQKLPVLHERLISGTVLKAEDFGIRWVPVRVSRDKPISDIRKLEGKTLRRMVNAGEPVYSSEVSLPYLVKAGEEVELIFNEQGIQIELKCESRQSGSRNEEVKIYCKETRKKYLGKIIGPGVVEWLKTQ